VAAAGRKNGKNNKTCPGLVVTMWRAPLGHDQTSGEFPFFQTPTCDNSVLLDMRPPQFGKIEIANYKYKLNSKMPN